MPERPYAPSWQCNDGELVRAVLRTFTRLQKLKDFKTVNNDSGNDTIRC